MNLARLAIKRPTFIMALLMVVFILGILSLGKLNVRMFPDVEFPYVIVVTTYPGAGVSEIEQLVTKPIEDALSGVSGLKHSGSVNQDNMSVVYGEFELSKNPDIATQEVRDKIGQIKNVLPDDIKEPIIMKADINNRPLVTMSLKSEKMSPKDLYDFADDVVSKDFAQISGVSRVNIVGGSKREIHVNADRKKLKEHGLTLTTLAAKIEANSLNIPAGKVTKGSEEKVLRTIGEFESIKQIGDVVVNFIGNDKHITVRDVAKIEDSIESEISKARLDIKKRGKIIYAPSLLLEIYRQAKGNDVAVSDKIKKKIIELNEKYKKYKGNPQLTMISDFARGVRMNIDDVKRTIFEGVFLAIIVVYLFLGSWRSTFITALALPNSLIGTFIFMYIFGFSLNVISLMALSLTVGLLIDDAIVVRENIFRHYEKGANPIKAAIYGTNEVTLAVVATTSTVIAVFFPVAFLNGIMGQFFREFGLTVVFAMIISIIDALTIAPMLSAYIIHDHDKKISNKWKIWNIVIKIFRACTVDWFNMVFDFFSKSYKKLISFVVKEKCISIIWPRFFSKNRKHFTISWKFLTLFIAVFTFLSTILIAKTYLKTTFMPESEWGEFNINVRAKPGTSLDQMDEYSKQIEKIIMNDSNIELISSSIGSGDMFTNLSNQVNIYVKMIPTRYRSVDKKNSVSYFSKFTKKTRTTSEMKDCLRKILNKKFGDELEFSITRQSANGRNESEFIMELEGDNIDVLYDFAKQLIKKCKTIPHFVDIQSNYVPGKPEIQIHMDHKKMKNFGVSSVIVGNEVRAMIDGALAGKYRENNLEYDIRVKFPDNQQDIVKDFNTIYISNVNNKLIKLENIAIAKNSFGFTQIHKKDRSRYVSIEGNVSVGGTIGEIQKEVLKIFNKEKSDPKNSDKWMNINYRFSGNTEDMSEMFRNILIAGVLSMVFIFMVLASLYESIIIPLAIMTALPLAIIGGVISLLIANQSIDIFTLIGMIMLLGIVAKNSILLVDCIQQLMRNGLNMTDSIIEACMIRLRPILMTSFAIIAGMLPTALGLSEVGKFRKGMGIVVIGGVVSSTILTLIVIPAIFEYTDRFRYFLRRIAGRPEKRIIDYNELQIKENDL
jgi:hydrophobe/amphiphile efflux-1 (HAE1) family protein